MTEKDASLCLVRPLLDIPKARLIATLQAAKIAFADDPSNRDPRFTRARLRGLMARAGRAKASTPARLALLAGGSSGPTGRSKPRSTAPTPIWRVCRRRTGAPRLRCRAALRSCRPKSRLRLLGRAVAAAGDEGPVELAKLESLENRARCGPIGNAGKPAFGAVSPGRW